MDHLQGATYRDYSTQPKRRHRSEIDNGGAGENAKTAPEKAEETVQDSELMAETLKRLYSDQPAETAAQAVEAAVEEAAGTSAADAPAEAAAQAAEAVEEAKQTAEEAAKGRRRRGKKSE